MDIENFEREKTIFDNDEDVIEYLRKSLLFIDPPPRSPTRALLIKSSNCHPCYRLVFGYYFSIHSIYTAIQEKRFIKENSGVMLYDAYFHTNPILDFWQENHLMRDVVSFGLDDSEGKKWDEVFRQKYLRYPEEATRQEIEDAMRDCQLIEGERPEGFDKFYVDLNNYVPSTVSLITNCFGSSSTCEVPCFEDQMFLKQEIVRHMGRNYNTVICRNLLESCFNPRLGYE